MGRIDLHMHSYYSDDGEFSPSELVELCRKKEITVMAIADHNTVEAVMEARKVASKYHIHYIDAIEIDCTYKDINLHVLGYGIDIADKAFNDLGKDILNQKIACSERGLELTNALGFSIQKEQMDAVSKDGAYTGEMFAEVLLSDPRYEEHTLLRPYRPGGKRGDNPYGNFYWDFYDTGKPCYTYIAYPALEETIRLIKQNGGVSVLAHPGVNLRGKMEVLEELIVAGLQGVEAFSSYHDEETAEYLLRAGRENGLLVTCSSDFHGKTKPSIGLGDTNCMLNESEIRLDLEKWGLLR